MVLDAAQQGQHQLRGQEAVRSTQALPHNAVQDQRHKECVISPVINMLADERLQLVSSLRRRNQTKKCDLLRGIERQRKSERLFLKIGFNDYCGQTILHDGLGNSSALKCTKPADYFLPELAKFRGRRSLLHLIGKVSLCRIEIVFAKVLHERYGLGH